MMTFNQLLAKIEDEGLVVEEADRTVPGDIAECYGLVPHSYRRTRGFSGVDPSSEFYDEASDYAAVWTPPNFTRDILAVETYLIPHGYQYFISTMPDGRYSACVRNHPGYGHGVANTPTLALVAAAIRAIGSAT